MFVDLTGKTRIKLALHMHTTLSDGKKTPCDVARIYIDNGYDAIALTDHWIWHGEDEIEGLKIISGCEYDVGGLNGENGVFHILAIGMTSDPEIPVAWRNMVKTSHAKACEIVKKIQKTNGLAIVAHPSWSLNTPEMLHELGEIDGVEIYNSVSDLDIPDRAYSDGVVDGLLTLGHATPIYAADDSHFYVGEECRAALMVEATDMESSSIVRALRQGRFYSTQGPEIHITRLGADRVRVVCTPAVKIAFFSNLAWTEGRIIKGEGLIEADYTVKDGERYVRAEVTDADCRKAWTNPIRFDELYRE